MSVLEPIPMGIAYSAATCRAQSSTLVASASSTGIAVQEGPCRSHSWSWILISLVNNQPDGFPFDLSQMLIEFDAVVAIEVGDTLVSGKTKTNSSNRSNSEATSAIASNKELFAFPNT
jgi:hypothetical protein